MYKRQVHEASTRSDVYHIVFCIVLLSMAFQGSLLAPAARKLNMCDKDIDVLKTFSDYSEEVDMRFICTKLPDGHEDVYKRQAMNTPTAQRKRKLTTSPPRERLAIRRPFRL